MRKPNCKCLECEKEIYRRPAQLVSGNIFCSSSCSNKRFKKPDIITMEKTEITMQYEMR